MMKPLQLNGIHILLLLCCLALLLGQANAFGAGSIPNYAFLHDRAFRHGDLANILITLPKTPHHHAGGGGGLADFFTTLTTKGLSAVLQGQAAATFSKSDVRRIYFGNWLRDYSQAIDIGGLSKLTLETLMIIVQTLGFMSFGFATREFHITPERLGVYTPVEHIDNPKGYGASEGDARKIHPKLRAPVNPKELEIDKKNGMKKYMATEGHSWDTSTAHIRRTLRECIALGRQVHLPHSESRRRSSAASIESSTTDSDDCEEMWEAFRLLGTALHTLEDLLAHSNWCELALVKMGYKEVFCHVGDKVRVKTPNGKAAPLVTGTFGSEDFLHSILGEASDQLSQASIIDLTVHMEETQSISSFSVLRSLLSSLPSFLNPVQKVEETEELEERAKGLSERRNSMSDDHHEGQGDDKSASRVDTPSSYVPPAEISAFLWDVLTWRDGVMRGVVAGIESIPGLGELLEQITDVLNQCVYTLLAPALIPILKEVTLALHEQSQAVIDTKAQYEVFDDPHASDPTHSILAKDHVDLILNEPAGRVAQIVVEYAVDLVVHAWYDRRDDPDKVIDKILEAFHHPFFASRTSLIQVSMLAAMDKWLSEYKPDEREAILSSLTKEAVREGRNKRIGSLANSTEETFSTLSYDETDAYASAREGSVISSRSRTGGGGDRGESENPLQDDLDSLAMDLSDRDLVQPRRQDHHQRHQSNHLRNQAPPSPIDDDRSLHRDFALEESRRKNDEPVSRDEPDDEGELADAEIGSNDSSPDDDDDERERPTHGSRFTRFWTELMGSWSGSERSKREGESGGGHGSSSSSSASSSSSGYGAGDAMEEALGKDANAHPGWTHR